MPIGIGDDHDAFAEAVSGWAARAVPTAATRARFDDYAHGGRPAFWDELVAMGVPGLHIGEEHGGTGAGFVELAVALEQTGRALVPGPLLPSVTASAAVQEYGGGALAGELLGRFAEGALGACADSAGRVRLSRSGDGLVASGETPPVLGAAGAEHLVLAGDLDGETVWFAVTDVPSRTAVERKVEQGVDLTRDVARVVLTEQDVPAARILGARGRDVTDLITTLQCAEAVALARWAQRTSLEYAGIREQFGRPIGSFQAIKHKCANLFVRIEVLTASVWDAVTAFDGGQRDQFALAAARTAVVCRREVVDVILECLTLLGGIGNTWEHDIHLYWRRAVSLLAVGGSQDDHALAAGERALTTQRGADLGVENRPAFRARVAGTLAEAAALPPDAARVLLADRGLVAPHYPEPYGLGADTAAQLIIAEEFAAAGLTHPTMIIGEWALPAILQYGTEEQKQRLVMPTLRDEIFWCQLFSEPGAGSDLASLSTAAVKVDGGWRIDGRKVWNSHAHDADWAICLARTDEDAPKHRGIGYFLIDMRSAGIIVSPLREANGDKMFNEVALEGVFVPDGGLVAGPTEGWRVARTTLANERVAMGAVAVAGAFRHDPAEVARELDAGRRAQALPELGRLTAMTGALDALARRGILQRISGTDPGAGASALKVASAQHITDCAAQVLEWCGPEAAVGSLGDDVIGGGRAAKAYLSTPSLLIGGGTREIQLNVIAERVLGLPREPRAVLP